MKGQKLGIFESDDIKTDLITLGESVPAAASPPQLSIDPMLSVPTSAPLAIGPPLSAKESAPLPESSSLPVATDSAKCAHSDEATQSLKET